MKKLLSIAFMFFLFSCADNSTSLRAIKSKESLRKTIGLAAFGADLKLDSTINFLPVDPSYLIIGKEISNTSNIDNYYIREYYSSKSIRKIVTLNYLKGKFEIIEEQDIYKKNDSDLIDVDLVLSYNYKLNEKRLRIDSLPTSKFKFRNQQKLKTEWEIAKKENMEICGTAANEILQQDFPQRHTYIDTILFKTYLNSFLSH